jgi:site-specific DNA-cytosine methylase
MTAIDAPKLMLDLYAGFGGQSEAFVDDENWDVLRIDNNPLLAEVPRMRIMDIGVLDPFNIGPQRARIEYIHASPPCHAFSLGFHAPKAVASRRGEEYNPCTKLVEKAKEIIDTLQPRFWSIENVRGSIKHLRPILGEPSLIVGAYVYWGRFPPVQITAAEIPKKSQKDKRHSPLRSNYRALIPLKLSSAFKEAIETQTRINETPSRW